MAKKKKKRGIFRINTDGWMMSYADMATILLAMFIILSTLGKDQTGASLNKGLESWRTSRQFFGLPGMFNNSAMQTQLGHRGPHYVHGQDDAEGGDNTSLDVEAERLQRFLGDMGGAFDVSKLPKAAGQATLDFFEPLNKQAPYLTAKHTDMMWQMLPLLRREEYRIVLVMWASMPVESAITRAAEQAHHVAEELHVLAALDATSRQRLVAVGQPWRHPHHQRPVMSLHITKVEKK